MKRLLYISIFAFVFSNTYAQAKKDENKSHVIYPVSFRETKPLSELMKENPENVNDSKETKEADDREFRKAYVGPVNPKAVLTEDPIVQKEVSATSTITVIQNFAGSVEAGMDPPDPTGSVGTNHYVQGFNSQYSVFNKTGTKLAGPTSLGNILFGSTAGDPCVLYDKFADRWVVTEFASSGNSVYIAVSKTNDPTGAYYSWTYTSPDFPDYLKFSIWTDGYYMTSNQSAQVVFVFERAQMLLGNTAARGIYASYSPTTTNGFFCPQAAFADGQLPPAGTPCPILSYEDDNQGGTADRINIYKMTTNWTAGTAAIALDAQVACAAFDGSYDTNWNDVAQYNSTQKLDAIGGVLMYRAQYRVWPGYNTVVLNWSVKNGSYRAIRWCELRQTGTTWSMYQQSTYAPDNTNRWCGSIAMDDNGNIAMGYTASSTTAYPSIKITGRLASDALNQMTATETTIGAGTGAHSGDNRWGDYTHTTIDPSDGTVFWYTGMYGASGGGYGLKICSFKFLSTGLNDIAGQNPLFYNTSYANNSINVKVANLPSNDELILDLFDINGRKIIGKTINPVSNSFETSFNTSGLAKGTYLVRMGKMNTSFQKVKKIVVD
jgi:hypothetical protein